MSVDYKVPFRSEDIIADAAVACRQITPTSLHPYAFDVVGLVEILVTRGVEAVFSLGGKKKGHLRIEFFERDSNWDDPAFVTFNPVTLNVDREIWAKAKAGDSYARSVIAHEIGHIILHDHNAKAFSSDKTARINFTGSQEDSAEWQAHTFMGHLLLPTATVRKFNDRVLLAGLCNAPDSLVDERLLTVRNMKPSLNCCEENDYCRTCGEYAFVENGICKRCQK